METKQSSSVVVLSTSESWALLRDGVIGRLAVLVDDKPDIFPINYLVDHGSIVFRTADGTKLIASVGHRVAFEVDSYDPSSGQAWSVVVKGVAREITKLHEVLDALELPLTAWHAAAKPRIVRIEPESISGRRYEALNRPAREESRPHRRTAPD